MEVGRNQKEKLAIQVHVTGMQPEERGISIPESPEPPEVHIGP